MTNTKRKASSGPQVMAFINPGPKVTLRLPGERTAKPMAKTNTAKKAAVKKPAATKVANGKRKRKGSGKGKRNGAAATRAASSQSRTSVAKKPAAKANPKRKQTRGWKNPLPSLGNVTLTEWGVFALAAIGTNALTSLIANPSSWAGIGIQAGLTFLAGKFAPRSVRTAATFGAGGAAVVGVVNRLTGGAIQNAITRYVAPLIPGAATQAQLPPAPATGMAGVYAVPRNFGHYGAQGW